MAIFLDVIKEARSENDKARESLLLFTEQTKPRYRTNWHHAELAKRLDRVARGECRRLMVFMPPRHGKSELVSRRFPAFMLGRNPDLRLIACSHTHDLAVSMNRDVQRIMTSDIRPGSFIRRIGNPSYSTDDLLTCRGHENPTACQCLFGAPFVRERKPLPENELRVCCPRLSVNVHGQSVAHELRGRIVSRLQVMSCVGDSRGSRFFVRHRCWTKPPKEVCIALVIISAQLLFRKYAAMGFVLAAVASGLVVSSILKACFLRSGQRVWQLVAGQSGDGGGIEVQAL